MDTAAIEQVSLLRTLFRFGLHVVLPLFDVVTDVIFLVNYSTSCVQTVFDADNMGGIYGMVLFVGAFATTIGILTALGVLYRLVWAFVTDESITLANALARRELGAKYKELGPATEPDDAVLASRSAGSAPASRPQSEGPQRSLLQRLRIRVTAFTLVHGLDVETTGPLSRGRIIRLVQSFFEDALQVAVLYALVAGMKANDSSTLLALYTSTAGLAATIGTELWNTLHCCRLHHERAETEGKAAGSGSKAVEMTNIASPGKTPAASASDAPATSSSSEATGTVASTNPVAMHVRRGDEAADEEEGKETAAASTKEDEHEAILSRFAWRPGAAVQALGRCSECACITVPCAHGPLRCCCRNQRCRTLATSALGRIVCVGMAVLALVVGFVSGQLSRYSSGVASLRVSVRLTVNGTIVTPNHGSQPVNMPDLDVDVDLRPYQGELISTSPASTRVPSSSEPFAYISAIVHNDAAISIGVGIQLQGEADKYGQQGMGCGLLWNTPTPKRGAPYPEIDITNFINSCLSSGTISQGYNIPPGACNFPISLHPAQAPYSPADDQGESASTYQSLFGEQCAEMTKNMHVTGVFAVRFVGTCDLSSL